MLSGAAAGLAATFSIDLWATGLRYLASMSSDVTERHTHYESFAIKPEHHIVVE